MSHDTPRAILFDWDKTLVDNWAAIHLAVNATMEAINGARLDITGITVTQDPAGVIRSDGADSQIELAAATIIGGDLTAINGGEIFLASSSTVAPAMWPLMRIAV